MLRNLLTERFRLSLHQETESIRGYLLTLREGGLKMRAAQFVAGEKPRVSVLDPSRVAKSTEKNRRLDAPFYPGRRAKREAIAYGHCWQKRAVSGTSTPGSIADC
jgi:uncharacterized protein (TIGR03435 family)